MDLIRSISWISSSHLRLVRDDDSHIDRLSHRYTVAICVLFAIIVSTKQYAGDPIDCWVPAQFKASYEKYADSYCWIAGSWYTPMDKELPLNERERRNQRIRYYQWVPFLLLFQAILCYIPRIIWRSFNVRSGLDLVNLIDAAIKYESVDKFSDREKIMAYIVRNIERYIGGRKSRYERLYGREFCINHNKKSNDLSGKNQDSLGSNRNRSRDQNKSCCNNCGTKLRLVLSTLCFWTGKRLGNYLVVLYMFVKTLWLTNAVSQLFLLNRFIGNDYHAFGIEIIEMLLSGQEWHELRHFPRVTYCDFKIREIGNSHDWTVQCVLRINLFNEVIYIFMWFWLCILALCTMVDYFTWIFRILIPADKIRFLKRHLDIYNYYSPKSHQLKQQKYKNNSAKPNNNFEYIDIEKEKKLLKEFTFNYLKDDGIFAMRILASSASDLIVTEIISELWINFKNNISELIVDETMIVTSPSSSSSASTSQGSSAVSTPVQQQESSKRHSHQQSSPSQANQQDSYSPPNFIKKPFNHGGNNIKVQYSPTSQHQQNINSIYSNLSLAKHNQLNQLSIDNNNNNTEFNQPPPVPNTIMPHLGSINTTNNSFDENKKNPMTVKDIFPNIPQTQISQQLSQHLHNVNANPNSKDTHV